MSVSGDKITIQNKLEIHADNTISVPGCEPISSLSSNTLMINMQASGYRGPVIGLQEALALIPGSTVEMMYNSGGALGTIRRFFVLPYGPPPSPGYCSDGQPICRPDWYKILKDNARSTTAAEEETSQSVDDICNFFSLQNKSGIL
jgi:hypothetical protein